MPEAPIKVVLADDHPIVLGGLRQLFENAPGFSVTACCQNGDEALTAVRAGQADVLVLDLRMPGLSGMDVLRTVKAEGLSCEVVMLTASLRDAQVTEVVQLGAKGLVLKESTPDVILECVRTVHRGELWIDPTALNRVVRGSAVASSTRVQLTPRESEIVRMLSEGLRNREMAAKLFITEGTVKLHLHNIYEKVGVSGRLELVLWAQQHGLA